ncbi:MAG: cyclic-di-AMP receptor [Anaerolineaceae bacterium]
MKLIMSIIKDEDNDHVSKKLTDEKFRVTFVASTGGFFRSGRSTLIIGVEDDRVERALQIIKENTTIPENADEKRATVFVLGVEEFNQL